MVSAGISWYGATKPFFVSEKGVKVNGPVYHKHLRTELFPAISKLVKKKIGSLHKTERHHTHQISFKDF